MVSKKKKEHHPQTTEELLKLYYGRGSFETRKKYENGLVLKAFTEAFEKEIPNLVNFKVEKIEELEEIKTPDYISEDRQIVIEATSIFMAPIEGEVIDSGERGKWKDGTKKIEKINEKVNHALEKDYDYLRTQYMYDQATGMYIVFILVDFLVAFFFDFYDNLKEAVELSIFRESNLSGIVFLTEVTDFSKKVAFIKEGHSVNLKEPITTYCIG